MASQDWIKPAEQELAKKFEAETGIHVDYQIIPSDQYFNVLKTKLNAGEATDIFGGQSGKSDLKLQYDVENNAVDLTGEEWTTRHRSRGPRHVQPGWQGLRRRDLGHHRLELLRRWSTTRTSSRSSGISVPKTSTEFKAACTTIMEAGITPIYEPISDGWHHVLWFPMVGPALRGG